MAVRGRKLTWEFGWSVSPVCFAHIAAQKIPVYGLKTIVETVDRGLSTLKHEILLCELREHKIKEMEIQLPNSVLQLSQDLLGHK